MKIVKDADGRFLDEEGRMITFNADGLDTLPHVGTRFVIGAITGDAYMLDFLFEIGEDYHPLIAIYKKFGRDTLRVNDLEVEGPVTMFFKLYHDIRIQAKGNA